MALLSGYVQRKKLEYFLKQIPKDAKILEVGCAGGWVGDYAKSKGWKNFIGIDILPTASADIVGDINKWKSLGMKPESFDAIIAFEVIEHGDFYQAFDSLLKKNGKLLVTTPLPHMDWLCKTFENLGLNQKRSSEHSHLIYLENVPIFELKQKKTKGFMSQWGVFEKK